MNPHLRATIEFIAFIAVVAVIWIVVPVHAHFVDYNGRNGIDLARCEGNQKMTETCGPLKGEDHLACDQNS